MPQAIAAMSMKMNMPRLLMLIGYRGVLISNTVILGVLLALFATIGFARRCGSSCFGFFIRGICVVAIYEHEHTCLCGYHRGTNERCDSIASTMQQMSISFGVAAAGLTTAFFIPGTSNSNPLAMIQGIHKSLFVPRRTSTIVSTIVFRSLKRGDGDTVNKGKIFHPGG